MKKHIPNLITLGNLLFGTIAAIAAVNGNYEIAALSVAIGIVLDFFDGFFARMLHVSGELGKQLDSLADMVTSGVVPGIIMYTLLQENSLNLFDKTLDTLHIASFSTAYLPYFGLLLTLAACYRLANFNIDERQSDSFIGMPTPAMSLFVVSLPLIPIYSDNQFFIDLIQNNYFLFGITLVLSFLMNAEIPLFSLKFKNYKVNENILKYVFILVSILMILFLKVIAIPLVIILYVVVSIGSNLSKKKA